MDQVKRKLTFNRTTKEEKKKLRNNFDRSITSIENLSNEYFYDIFDYLDSYEIYKAFSNLNYHFQQLLNSSSLLFKIKLNFSNYNQLDMNDYKQFLFANKHKILSIKLWSGYENNYFFSLFTINSSLIRLRSLFVQPNQPDILISLLMNLTYLPHLFSLTIDRYYHPKNVNDIYRLVFVLPVLKSFIFYLNSKDDSISFPMSTNKQLSPIEYLRISHSCTFDELFTILSYTPQLRRLDLLNSIDIDRSIQTRLPNTLLNLTNILINIDNIKFDEFEILIRKMNVKLKSLRVNTLAQDVNFLNAHRWEQLILRSLSQLEEFYLQYYEPVVNGYIYPIFSGELNQFTSSFWIERQWTFEAEIIHAFIYYFIRPYRKRWYEDNILNSSVEYSKSTRLIIKYIDLDDLIKMIRAATTRILTIAQIYHLEISAENVPINVLLETVNLLPELNTLKIHSLSLYKPRMLNEKELIILSSIEDRSQIRKVYLGKMNEIKELDFLFELCPYMEYFKIDYIKHMDFKFVLRYIIKHDCNDYLHLLCFRIPTADDEMIKKLKSMIHFEKLLFNYTIKRVADNIYVEWK